jgi:hypothetical protein
MENMFFTHSSLAHFSRPRSGANYYRDAFSVNLKGDRQLGKEIIL